ncbi:MAG TPA: exonuclease domain-containing protein [Desulfuromonadales bacterium]|nr:exonuclease domain-containing protein [Desulfuromonadales bacterium]
MIPDRFVFIDLETTGTNASRDRITEVGLCEVLNGELVEEWSTLVNPGKSISPFIEQLTGISTAMVAEAPRFEDLADELFDRLRGKILVAHNARFDTGFLKSEFRRLDIPFQEKTLCTLKLSRTIYPQHRRHNLDALIERHGLGAQDRHRALGDARATWKFFEKVRLEQSPDIIEKALQKQLKKQSLPPHLPAEQIEQLPSSAGVYLFYGENDAILYVGKSIDIRSRVNSHFSEDHRAHKGMRLSQQVRRIDFIETAGELGALLLEARLVKDMTPIHNRRLRRTRDLFSIRLLAGKNDGSKPQIVSHRGLCGEDLEGLFGLFRSRRKAEEGLRDIIQDQGLCNRVLGLDKGTGACFNYQIRKCRGACVGKEPLPLHEARLVNALAALKMRSWPFSGPVGIRERSRKDDRTDIHVFDRWCHLGTADSEDRLRDILSCPSPLPFDLDSYKILTRFLDSRDDSDADLLDLSQPQYNTGTG